MRIVDLVDGYVPAVTEVNGVAEFERVLSHWVNTSNRSTADTRPTNPRLHSANSVYDPAARDEDLTVAVSSWSVGQGRVDRRPAKAVL